MPRNISLLILCNLLSSAFPSMGWTETCFEQSPSCTVHCPGSSKVHIICDENSNYYSCSNGHRPSIYNCICPSNFQLVKNTIKGKTSFIEATCIPSANPVSHPTVVTPTPLLPPKDSSSPQVPPSVAPSAPAKPPLASEPQSNVSPTPPTSPPIPNPDAVIPVPKHIPPQGPPSPTDIKPHPKKILLRPANKLR